MRLNISNDRPYMIGILESYLNKTILHQEVEAVINGIKYKGKIEEPITFSKNENHFTMNLHIGELQEQIPIFLDKTKIRVGKTFFVFQTNNHNTVIEVV